MSESNKIVLPSGVELKLSPAPFSQAKALYQALLEELKSLRLDPDADIDMNLIKDLFCTGFSSKKVEAALNPCMQRAVYDGARISDSIWESEAAREDYVVVCWEVAQLNVRPFLKNLSHVFSRVLETVPTLSGSKSSKTTS